MVYVPTMVTSANVEASFFIPNAFHLLSVLAFRSVLFDPEFLKVDICSVEHTARVACVSALVKMSVFRSTLKHASRSYFIAAKAGELC